MERSAARARAKMAETAQRAVFDGDPVLMQQAYAEYIASLSTVDEEKDFFDRWEEIAEDSVRLQDGFISTGHRDLDKIFGGGYLKGDFFMLWGVDGLGKSWLAIQLGMKAITQGRRVLHITNEMLKQDVDAVFVTSPDFLHEEHGIAALSAGKHVYLEKPMAITIEGCDRLLAAARDSGTKLYLGHNMRHSSITLKMKELIDSGAIGEVRAGWCRHFVAYGGDAYFKDWHAERSKATSLLLQKGAHDIDVLHWLCGGFTTRVTAMGKLSVYNQIKDRHDAAERGDADWSNANWPPLSQTGLNPKIDIEDLSSMLMVLRQTQERSIAELVFESAVRKMRPLVGLRPAREFFVDRVVGDVVGQLRGCVADPDSGPEAERGIVIRIFVGSKDIVVVAGRSRQREV